MHKYNLIISFSESLSLLYSQFILIFFNDTFDGKIKCVLNDNCAIRLKIWNEVEGQEKI